MPLPNVLRDPSLRCEATKRNGERCRGIKAYSTSRCTHHGANKGKKQHGKINGNYKAGDYTKETTEKTRKNIVKLRYLEDIGQQGGFMTGTRTRVPKPNGYVKLDIKNKEELVIALKVIEDQK